MSDTCQTPGCGHGKASHDPRSGWCHYPLNDCACTLYTAQTELPNGCCRNAETHASHIAHTRSGVLAAAEDALEEHRELTRQNLLHPDQWPLEHDAFIAGYLAAKGLDA